MDKTAIENALMSIEEQIAIIRAEIGKESEAAGAAGQGAPGAMATPPKPAGAPPGDNSLGGFFGKQ